MKDMIQQVWAFKVKGLDTPEEENELAKNREVWVRASSVNEDRDGDVVITSGIDLTKYRDNPVGLLNHDWNAHPIAKCTDIIHRDHELLMKMQFDDDPDAEKVYQKVKKGFIHSVSIGFRALKVSPREHKDYGFVIEKSELLEVSFVTIPANGDCTVLAKSYSDEDYIKSMREVAKAFLKMTEPLPLPVPVKELPEPVEEPVNEEILEEIEAEDPETFVTKDLEPEEEVLEVELGSDSLLNVKTLLLELEATKNSKFDMSVDDFFKEFEPEEEEPETRIDIEANREILDNAQKSLATKLEEVSKQYAETFLEALREEDDVE